MHNELWARTWQVVTLGTAATFAFIGLLVVCLKIMSAWARGGETEAETGKETEKE